MASWFNHGVDRSVLFPPNIPFMAISPHVFPFSQVPKIHPCIFSLSSLQLQTPSRKSRQTQAQKKAKVLSNHNVSVSLGYQRTKGHDVVRWRLSRVAALGPLRPWVSAGLLIDESGKKSNETGAVTRPRRPGRERGLTLREGDRIRARGLRSQAECRPVWLDLIWGAAWGRWAW